MQNFRYKMDNFLDAYYKANKNSGILRITSKDEVIYEKFMGYADIENKTEFSKNSIAKDRYPIGDCRITVLFLYPIDTLLIPYAIPYR